MTGVARQDAADAHAVVRHAFGPHPRIRLRVGMSLCCAVDAFAVLETRCKRILRAQLALALLPELAACEATLGVAEGCAAVAVLRTRTVATVAGITPLTSSSQ